MHKKIFLIILTLLLLSIFPSCTQTNKKDHFFVDILDIGKADCIVIRADKHTIMIDCGEKENANEIVSFLKTNKIRTIDYLILSHFDKDHIGGVNDVLKNVEVKNVLESTFSSDRDEYRIYHKTLEDQKIPLLRLSEDHNILLENDLNININVPKKNQYARKQDNNASLIVKVTKNSKNLLFCGDAMEERIEEFMKENSTSYDLVKLPYHGNYLENYPDLIDFLNPANCIITCSKKNPPDEETLNLLNNKKVPCYLTENGNIRIILSKEKTQIFQ